MQYEQQAERRIEQQITTLDVHELMLQDETRFLRGKCLLECGRKQQHRTQHAGDCRTGNGMGYPHSRNAAQPNFLNHPGKLAL